MRVLLVVNAAASAVTPRVRVVIAKALAEDHDLIVSETAGRGHATELAAEAARVGYGAVVALGGDGTVNEVANGLVGTSTALGVLPGGSTNVFARTLGTAGDPVEATGQLLASLAAGARRRIGLGRVGERHFLFHLGVGFDAAVIDRVDRRGPLKRYAGHPLFIAAAVDTFVRHYDRRSGFLLRLPDGEPARSVFAVVLNSDPYTYLGRRPLHLSPGTTPDTGLGLVSFRSLGVGSLLVTVAAALGSGRAVGRTARVTTGRGLARLDIEADTPFAYQVDGEYLGESLRLEIEHHPAALDLVPPAPLPPRGRRGADAGAAPPRRLRLAGGRRGRRPDGS